MALDSSSLKYHRLPCRTGIESTTQYHKAGLQLRQCLCPPLTSLGQLMKPFTRLHLNEELWNETTLLCHNLRLIRFVCHLLHRDLCDRNWGNCSLIQVWSIIEEEYFPEVMFPFFGFLLILFNLIGLCTVTYFSVVTQTTGYYRLLDVYADSSHQKCIAGLHCN